MTSETSTLVSSARIIQNGQPLLAGKVAVITGGTRGIGFETARVFLENGAKVVIFGSRAESIEKALTKLESAGVSANMLRGHCPNLADFDSIDHVMRQILTEWGTIDILINNAGISANKPIDFTDPQDFDQIIDLNLNAMFRCIKSVVPTMKTQGHGVILNTSSMVSHYGQPTGVGYPASKFAVNGLTKSLARELASFGIRVNAVAPGVVNTDMIAKLPEAQLQPVIASIPLGRIAEPRDIANAFLFLASDLASYITGDILSVDGAARS